jgi:hypothetical protein
MNPPRAADDFATIRARMEELRRDREAAHASESELDQSGRSARNAYGSQREIDRRARTGPTIWPHTRG